MRGSVELVVRTWVLLAALGVGALACDGAHAPANRAPVDVPVGIGPDAPAAHVIEPGVQVDPIRDEKAIGARNTAPGGFELVTVAPGLTQGVGFAFAPGERIYIVEKRGVVRLWRAGQLREQPVLDMSSEVNGALDRGLLGIAVHPAFPEQPYLYLLHVYDPPEVSAATGDAGPDGNGARVSRLVRVEADPATGYATVKPGSALVLLGQDSVFANIGNPSVRNDYEHPSCGTHGSYVRDCLASDENSHSIGTVAFGPDGALYVGNGDGSS